MSKASLMVVMDILFAQELLLNQFPQWKDLPIQEVELQGNDNRTFRIGSDMLMRFPSAKEYAHQVEKEHKWLLKLAPLLPLPIPQPLEMGKPTNNYPYHWSIYRWLEGETASTVKINDLKSFAKELAQFLNALQSIDVAGAPLPGAHNFYRGGSLKTYDDEACQAIDILKDKIEVDLVKEVWQKALVSSWQSQPVWVHGDINADNLLASNGKLRAVIDFGLLAIGDPACDLVIAWTFFDGDARGVFRRTLKLDPDTWARARGWALWKALITLSNPANTTTKPWEVVERVLKDHAKNGKD